MEFLAVSGASGIEMASEESEESKEPAEVYDYVLPYNTAPHGVQPVYNTASKRISIFYTYDEGKVMIDTLQPKQMANYVRWSDFSWERVGPKCFI